MTISKELTPRERMALALAAEGLSNDAIGARMAISRSTVRSHLKSVFYKLGALDRCNAVHLGWQQGILPTEVLASGDDVFAVVQ